MAYLSAQDRDRVASLTASDFRRAMTLAREVTDPWYRCQSLAIVAWSAPTSPERVALALEALRTSNELQEPNRAVSVSAWPIRVLVSHDQRRATAAVGEAIDRIGQEPNPVRRADALLLLLQAVFELPSLRAAVLAPLVAACQGCRAWKASWIFQRAIIMLAATDRTEALRLAPSIVNPRKRRQTVRDLTSSQSFETPELFWWLRAGVA